jgi:ABC-type cobalamin/Fe3+-siderophores transport system ATPase subunit
LLDNSKKGYNNKATNAKLMQGINYADKIVLLKAGNVTLASNQTKTKSPMPIKERLHATNINNEPNRTSRTIIIPFQPINLYDRFADKLTI